MKTIKYSIWHLHVQTQQETPLETDQVYSKLTIKTPGRRLVFLLLTLTMIRTLFSVIITELKQINVG